MYVKDMPSIAAAACRDEILDSGRDERMDEEDSVLDGVIDDRITAAYAIVELGERDSRKTTAAEFASSELDEELEVDDLDHYHQVPSSPEYCRKKDRRRSKYDDHHHNRSTDSSPVRRSLAESNAPRSVGQHVRGAVMPSRTNGKPEAKLIPKRRLEEEEHGIKAKLARMLFEKKTTARTDLSERSSQDDEKETGYKGLVVLDEERPVEKQGGRFVRTSMPIRDPVNVVSGVQSPARCEQQDKRENNLEVRLEQSFSAEEINRLRESLLRQKESGEESADDRAAPNPAYYSSSTQGMKLKTSATTDLVIPASLSPSPTFPNIPECKQALSSGDANVQRLSQFPPQTQSSEHFIREATSRFTIPPSWAITNELRPYIFVGPAGESVLNSTARFGNSSQACEPTVVKTVVPGTGFVQYFVMSATNPTRNSSNPVSSLDYHNSKVTEPVVMVKQEVDDAMTKLENFTLGKQLYGGSQSRPELTVSSDTRIPYLCLAPQAKTSYPRLGSLNSISNYYSLANSPASSEAWSYPSNASVSRSCHDLTSIPSKSQDIRDDIPRRPSPDLKHRRPKSSESAQGGNTRRAQRVCKNRRKVPPGTCALDMVRGGEFGSLGAIRNFYNGLNSRSAPNLSEQSSKKLQLVELTKSGLSQSYGEVAQDCPLDLSSCRRNFSAEQRLETKLCTSECQSFSVSKTSVPVRINDDFLSPWQSDLHAAQTRSHVLCSPQSKVNTPEPLHSSSVGATVENTTNPSLASNSLSNNIPNSSLPPKKRKFRQPSQSRDFAEVKTMTSATSVGSSAAHLRQGDSKPDSGTSEALRVGQLIVSPAETGFVLTPEMKLLENKVGVRDEDGDLPLHIAVAKGHLEFVQKVLLPMMSQNGVHIDICNHQRQTALHLAVITNQPQMVETLLKASASASICDRKGNTAVHLAVRYKTPACLRHILASSRIQLDLDAKNYEGLTALHLGVQLGEREAVKTLLTNGSDPNAMDGTNGRTPLFYAVETNDYIMASILLKYGSNPCIASYSGCTPLQIATAKSFRDMTNMLERSFPRGLAVAADQEERSYGQHV